MVPADDQAIVFPCASVIVIMVLLNVAFTCATPEAIFLRSRRRTRVASLPILHPLAGIFPQLGPAVARRSRQLALLLILLFGLTSSCRRSAWPAPCGCGRWYGCAGHGRVVRDDVATLDSSRGPSAA